MFEGIEKRTFKFYDAPDSLVYACDARVFSLDDLLPLKWSGG